MLSPAELKNLSHNNFAFLSNYLSKAHSCSTYRKQQFFGTAKSRDQYQIIDPTNCHLRVVCTFGWESAQAQKSIKQNKTNAEHISDGFLCVTKEDQRFYLLQLLIGIRIFAVNKKADQCQDFGCSKRKNSFLFRCNKIKKWSCLLTKSRYLPQSSPFSPTEWSQVTNAKSFRI